MSWQYFPDTFTLDDYTTVSETTVTDDEYRTVERLELERGEAHRLGKGEKETLTDAEGRLYFDAQDDGAATLDAKMRFVVENVANNQQRVIYGNSISSVTRGEADETARTPFAYRDIDIKYPFKVAVQLQMNDGTATYDSGNSTLEYNGYRGEQMG